MTVDEAIDLYGEPTDVSCGHWEDDPDSQYEQVDHVPVDGSLLRGFTYREVRSVRFYRQKRLVTYFWRYPDRYEIAGIPPTAFPLEEGMALPAEMTYTVNVIPARVIALNDIEHRASPR